MRPDIPAPSDTTFQQRDNVTFRLYAEGVSYLNLINGTGGAYVDLTPFVSRCPQSETEMTVDMAYRDEFSGANRPIIGQLVQVLIGGYALFTGHVDAIGAETESRGERSISLTVRRRDATPAWRDVRRCTPAYSVGADLGQMAEDMARAIGLDPAEVVIGNVGLSLAHDSTQIADVNAWDALTLCLTPSLLEPWVDGRGVLRTISRNLRRPTDIELTSAQIKKITSGTSRPPCTVFRVKFIDFQLSKVSQADQRLGHAVMTCGFFKINDYQEVWWSQGANNVGGKGQRAEQTYMKTVTSINDGLVRVGTVTYEAADLYHGIVRAEMDTGWFIAELAVAIAALAGSAAIPDTVQVGPTGSGVTIPVGRIAHNLALMALLQVIMHIGHGVYEVWGVPFDEVYAVNEVEAYDINAPDWAMKLEEDQNDLIPSDEVAQTYAVNELLYRSCAASQAGMLIADDPRIERGDVLGVPDGRQFYVQKFKRNLQRGVEALLELTGFWLINAGVGEVEA